YLPVWLFLLISLNLWAAWDDAKNQGELKDAVLGTATSKTRGSNKGGSSNKAGGGPLDFQTKDGEILESSQLVPGDVVYLSKSALRRGLPADLVLVSAEDSDSSTAMVPTGANSTGAMDMVLPTGASIPD
ncbi:unnamed protein product, partial [Amoebophrya sp. A25]